MDKQKVKKYLRLAIIVVLSMMVGSIITIFIKDLQPKKASLEIFVKPSGRSTSDKTVQPRNVAVFISFIFSEILIPVKEEHARKAKEPKLVTLFGITTSIKLLQPSKA